VAAMTLAGSPQLGLGAEKKQKYGGRFRVGERQGPTGLDVHKNQYVLEYLVYNLMYNALTILGPLPEANVYPDVAKSWEVSKDGMEYLFLLREGVKFHHGKEMDSGDVKYSIERVMNPATRSPRASAFDKVESVQAVDKYRLKIRLKETFGPFATKLTIQTCPIIPAGWEPTATKPAPGTGPFAFKSMVINETVDLVRFPQYWEVDKKTGERYPFVDSITVTKIVDEMTRWTALQTGDVEYISATPANITAKELEKPTPGIVIPPPVPVGVMCIYFNCAKPPFDNKKVRQAVAYAIDKKEVEKGALWGLGVALNNQFFLEGSAMYSPVKDREVDLAKARQLLAEAGYPNGFKTEFFEFSHAQTLDSCNVIAGQLKKIGIEATIKIIDRAPYEASMRKGDYAMSAILESIRLDPDDAYYYSLHSDEISKNNWSRYSNKEMDRLLVAGRKGVQWEQRAPFYKEVVELIKEDLPIFYLSRPKTPAAYRSYVKGFEAGAGTWSAYYGGGFLRAWLDK
jgi:peptide/nickel transport system substrate-binding protein